MCFFDFVWQVRLYYGVLQVRLYYSPPPQSSGQFHPSAFGHPRLSFHHRSAVILTPKRDLTSKYSVWYALTTSATVGCRLHECSSIALVILLLSSIRNLSTAFNRSTGQRNGTRRGVCRESIVVVVVDCFEIRINFFWEREREEKRRELYVVTPRVYLGHNAQILSIFFDLPDAKDSRTRYWRWPDARTHHCAVLTHHRPFTAATAQDTATAFFTSAARWFVHRVIGVHRSILLRNFVVLRQTHPCDLSVAYG